MGNAHVGNWAALVLSLLVVACGAVWMATGTLKTTASVTGVNDGGTLTVYVSPEKAVQIGMASGKVSGQPIELDGEEVGQVLGYVSSMSRDQVLAEYDNLYITDQLDLSEDNVVFCGELRPDACPDGVVSVDVVTAETTPWKLLMDQS